MNARLCRIRAGNHPLDGRRLDFDGWNLVDEAVVEEHQHEGQNEVGEGAGKTDQHLLPARMRRERAGIVCRGHGFLAGRVLAGRFQVLLRAFAGHFDVAAKRKQANLVVRVAVFIAEEARPKAQGKGLDAHSAELGDDKVAKLVEHHHDGDQNDEGDDSNDKFMHKCLIFP